MIRKRIRLVKRIGSALAHDHPFLLSLVIVTIVGGIFQYRTEQQRNDLGDFVECTRAVVTEMHDSTEAYRAAQKVVDDQEDVIWDDVEVVLTQTATSVDYDALTVAVHERNVLRREQEVEQKKNPLPPTPDKFCEGVGER